MLSPETKKQTISNIYTPQPYPLNSNSTYARYNPISNNHISKECCLSTPRSKEKTREKLKAFAQLSPEPKNSRKKAYINKALFSSSKNQNKLQFDDVFNEKVEFNYDVKKSIVQYNYCQSDENLFDINIHPIKIEEEYNKSAHEDTLFQAVIAMKNQVGLRQFFKSPEDSLCFEILSKRIKHGMLDQSLIQLYSYIKDMDTQNIEFEIDELEYEIMVSTKLSSITRSGNCKEMVISALFEKNQDLITQMKIQFI